MAERTLPFQPARSHSPQRRNVGRVDRWVSAITGALMLSTMGKRRSTIGKAWALTSGAMLLTRAATGHSRVYEAAGISTERLAEGGGISIESAVTVQRPREELYRFWRDPTNLPRVMSHVESVTGSAEGVSHWVVRGPRKLKLEWDAAMMNEEPYERIAWHSMDGSAVEQTGSVQFEDAGDRGTTVRLRLRYVPPAGLTGLLTARVLNHVTEAEIAEDLRRFKHLMEAGIAESQTGRWAGEGQAATTAGMVEAAREAEFATSASSTATTMPPAEKKREEQPPVPEAEETTSHKPHYVPDLP